MNYFTLFAQFLTQFSSAIMIFGLIFMSGQKKRKYFYLRLTVLIPYCLLFCSSVGKLLGITAFQEVVKKQFVFGWADFSWLVIFAACVAIWFLLYDAKFINLMFFASVAYCAQHAVAYLGRTVSFFFSEYAHPGALVCRLVIHLASYAAAFFLITPSLTKKIDSRPNSLLTVLFFVVTILLISFFSAMIFNTGKETQITCIYSCVVASLLFGIQIGSFDYQIKADEKAYIERMFYEQSRQRERYNENIKQLNMKYHDLKHYVSLMKAGKAADGIDEIEKVLSVYDSRFETGNAVLDMLLSEKKVYADKAEIAMNVIGEAKDLSFMKTADIYALFGNAIDNAFEAVEKYEKEKRFVRVVIGSDNRLFRIRVENYFDGELGEKNEDGSPVTTKADKSLHGFGIKSMKYIAEKYKGNMCIDLNPDLFVVSFMFPLD